MDFNMKKETLLKLKKLVKDERLEFVEDSEGLAINYTMSDEELRELVETEYGPTYQPIEELFKVMIKKLLKNALEK